MFFVSVLSDVAAAVQASVNRATAARTIGYYSDEPNRSYISLKRNQEDWWGPGPWCIGLARLAGEM